MIDDTKTTLISGAAVLRDNIQNDHSIVNINYLSVDAELIVLKHTIPQGYSLNFKNDDSLKDLIKEEFCKIIAREILKSKVVEFSYLTNVNTFNTEVIARLCIAKKENTRFLVGELKRRGWEV